MIKKLKLLVLRYSNIIDLPFSILIILPAIILKYYRVIGSRKLRLCTKILKKIGVFPIRDHYYEPSFKNEYSQKKNTKERFLPGINLHEKEQLKFLKNLVFKDEFINFVEKENFDLYNKSFLPGDSDLLFQYIRNLKPKKIIEIGSGNSTIIANHALSLNKQKNDIISSHVCIEPFEQPWLDSFEGIKIIRKKVECIQSEVDWRNDLVSGDLLFIDSSHVIRPDGDVLFEYLEILPQLNNGVHVHIHDIFTPRDYLINWLSKDIKFWNEQYLLEALISNSDRYRIVASLNWLKHNYYDELKEVCPFLETRSEPGSFYLQIR